MNKRLVTISKLLSLVLRHRPEVIGITLDNSGYVDVNELIQKINAHKNIKLDLRTLKDVVDNNDKKRFAFNADFTKIRASQGHSIDVDVEFEKINPPDILYHGTAKPTIEKILKSSGLVAKNRLYVHLSGDTETAKNVGRRHGVPAILIIDAKQMHQDGLDIFISANGVYLTKEVPLKYITKYEKEFNTLD